VTQSASASQYDPPHRPPARPLDPGDHPGLAGETAPAVVTHAAGEEDVAVAGVVAAPVTYGGVTLGRGSSVPDMWRRLANQSEGRHRSPRKAHDKEDWRRGYTRRASEPKPQWRQAIGSTSNPSCILSSPAHQLTPHGPDCACRNRPRIQKAARAVTGLGQLNPDGVAKRHCDA